MPWIFMRIFCKPSYLKGNLIWFCVCMMKVFGWRTPTACDTKFPGAAGEINQDVIVIFTIQTGKAFIYREGKQLVFTELQTKPPDLQKITDRQESIHAGCHSRRSSVSTVRVCPTRARLKWQKITSKTPVFLLKQWTSVWRKLGLFTFPM